MAQIRRGDLERMMTIPRHRRYGPGHPPLERDH